VRNRHRPRIAIENGTVSQSSGAAAALAAHPPGRTLLAACTGVLDRQRLADLSPDRGASEVARRTQYLTLYSCSTHRRFHKAYPAIRVRLSTAPNATSKMPCFAIPIIVRGRGGRTRPGSELDYQHLFFARLGLIAPPGHRCSQARAIA